MQVFLVKDEIEILRDAMVGHFVAYNNRIVQAKTVSKEDYEELAQKSESAVCAMASLMDGLQKEIDKLRDAL